MRNKKLLIKLAEYIETVPHSEFDMTKLDKDAMYYAAHLPEFKRAGLKYYTENGTPVVEYKGARYEEAMQKFFEIEAKEADYLFSHMEYDEEGRMRPSIFAPDPDRRRSREFKYTRDGETPAWAAERIRAFARSKH